MRIKTLSRLAALMVLCGATQASAQYPIWTEVHPDQIQMNVVDGPWIKNYLEIEVDRLHHYRIRISKVRKAEAQMKKITEIVNQAREQGKQVRVNIELLGELENGISGGGGMSFRRVDQPYDSLGLNSTSIEISGGGIDEDPADAFSVDNRNK